MGGLISIVRTGPRGLPRLCASRWVEGLNDTGVVCMKADNPVRDDATMSAFRDVDGAIILLCTFTGGTVRLFVKQMLSVGFNLDQ